MLSTVRSILSTAHNGFQQTFFIPAPPITEANTPDQTGRVHLVTGGYAGCGEQLAQLLYAAHASVWIAGRSQAKADAAMARIRAAAPASHGSLHFLPLDLADLASIAPAAARFRREARDTLHVLTNNAGVMVPPAGSASAQGHELQLATNCLGPFLLARLLLPALRATARAAGGAPGAVRVTWAGSMAVDLASPRGGIAFDDRGGVRALGRERDYGQSKAGNLFLANEFARREGCGREEGIVQVCWNPGNLESELQRHISSFESLMIRPILYPAKYGAYTELYSALSPDLASLDKSGAYVAPWGRVGHNRSDIEREIQLAKESGQSNSQRFYQWCEQETAQYMQEAAKL